MALITLPKAAKQMGISAPTLRNYVRDGGFPGKIVPSGREGHAKYLIDEDNVKKYLEQATGDIFQTGLVKTMNDALVDNARSFHTTLDNNVREVKEVKALLHTISHTIERNGKPSQASEISNEMRNQNINKRFDDIEKRFATITTQLSDIMNAIAKTTLPSPIPVKKSIVVDPLSKFGGR